MTKQDRIADFYKVLVEFEELQKDFADSSYEAYMNHLDRLYTTYLGHGNVKIYEGVRGLIVLGKNATHPTVKRMVFHIINLLDKEG